MTDSKVHAPASEADVAAIVARFDAGPAVVVGHSLGARNAIVAGALHPKLVRAVVAIDFTPYIEATMG